MIDRRQWLLASSALAAAFALGSRSGFAQGRKTLRVAIGQKAIAPNLVSLLIGEALGYNAAEGFRAEFLMVGSPASGKIAIDKADADISTSAPSHSLPLLARNQWGDVVNFFEYTYPYKWDVAVRKDSKAKSYFDLKGLNVGVSEFASTEYAVTRNIVRKLGLDPDRDVKWTSVGNGVTAGLALQSGAIDALAYYDTGFGQIEAAGIEFSMLPLPKDVPMIGGFFLIASRDQLQKNRDLLTGYGRSVAKASTFLSSSPEAGAKVFLKTYPEVAPRGSSQQDAIKAILTATARRIRLFQPPYPNAKIGSINPEEFRMEAEMNNLVIKNFSGFHTNELINDINKFDRAKIEAEARTYAG